VEIKTTTVEWVTPGSAAAQAGIEPGDILSHFAENENPDWEKVYISLNLDPDQTVPITIQRHGAYIGSYLHIPAKLKEGDFAGMVPQFMPGPIHVQDVQPGAPAAQAGLMPGDDIRSVDGHPFHSVSSLLAYMQDGKGKPISLEVARNGQILSLVAHPAKLDAGYKLGIALPPAPYHIEPLPLDKAAAKSTSFCVDNSVLIFETLKRLVDHRVPLSQLMGPVGIARAAGDAAESKGWLFKLNLAGQISINLGILNLMPFPILDGGMILFLLIESTIRREINLRVKEYIYQAAFMLLVVFFAFIIFNDVSKLPYFTHLKP
jgi:regulator of sigma E protease